MVLSEYLMNTKPVNYIQQHEASMVDAIALQAGYSTSFTYPTSLLHLAIKQDLLAAQIVTLHGGFPVSFKKGFAVFFWFWRFPLFLIISIYPNTPQVICISFICHLVSVRFWCCCVQLFLASVMVAKNIISIEKIV